MKPTFKGEISLGQILILVGLLATLGIIEVPRASEVAVLKTTVAEIKLGQQRQQLLLEKLTDNQAMVTRSLDKVSVLLELHIDQTKKSP